LTRLPEKYRIPVILCDLEGRTLKEAAGQLGVPIGTVSSRLARARAMLAGRLSRPGRTLSVGTLTVLLAEEASAASMPARLIGPTARAASRFAGGDMTARMVRVGVVALTQEVLKTMLLGKLKIATTLVMGCLVLASGATVLALGIRPGASDPAVGDAALAGTWDEVTPPRNRPGEQVTLPTPELTFRGNVACWERDGRIVRQSLFALARADSGRAIDFVTVVDGTFRTTRAVFAIADDTLTLREGAPDGPRPEALVAGGSGDAGRPVRVYRRRPPAHLSPAVAGQAEASGGPAVDWARASASVGFISAQGETVSIPGWLCQVLPFVD
jgi:hypothetical protein